MRAPIRPRPGSAGGVPGWLLAGEQAGSSGSDPPQRKLEAPTASQPQRSADPLSPRPAGLHLPVLAAARGGAARGRGLGRLGASLAQPHTRREPDTATDTAAPAPLAEPGGSRSPDRPPRVPRDSAYFVGNQPEARSGAGPGRGRGWRSRRSRAHGAPRNQVRAAAGSLPGARCPSAAGPGSPQLPHSDASVCVGMRECAGLPGRVRASRERGGGRVSGTRRLRWLLGRRVASKCGAAGCPGRGSGAQKRCWVARRMLPPAREGRASRQPGEGEGARSGCPSAACGATNFLSRLCAELCAEP